MGRWYEDPSEKEIRAVVGDKPLKQNLTVLQDGTFQLIGHDKSSQKRLQQLLSSGKILLKMPKTSL